MQQLDARLAKKSGSKCPPQRGQEFPQPIMAPYVARKRLVNHEIRVDGKPPDRAARRRETGTVNNLRSSVRPAWEM